MNKFITRRSFLFLNIIGLITLVPFADANTAVPQPVNQYSMIRDEHLKASGVAFDAKEDIVGMIHITDPKTFFKPDTAQVTWWGEFEPFEAWTRPELEARWFDAQGNLMATQQFRGTICRLAKTTLQMTRPMEGKMNVEIYYKGELLDRKNFFLFDPKASKTNQSTLPSLEISGLSTDR